MFRGARLVIGIFLVFTTSAVFVPSALAVDRDGVNAVYRQIVDLLQSDAKASPKAISEIVRRNPAAAEECLKRAEAKGNAPGQQGAALREFAYRLEEAVYLVSGGGNCRDPVAHRLLDRLKDGRLAREDNYFVLENLVRLCPGLAKSYHMLGDQYYEERRFGMAVATYRKGLALEFDPDSKKRLAESEAFLTQYSTRGPITAGEMGSLMRNSTTMGPSGITRKVDMEVRIQRQILFDEWSYRIKDQFSPELKAVGEALRKEFAANNRIGILIEGHTDRRGPLEKNTRLSWDRAESVKRFLVEHGAIDPSRIKTAGFGPTKPYDPRDNEEGWTLNRRVEFKKINLSTQ